MVMPDMKASGFGRRSASTVNLKVPAVSGLIRTRRIDTITASIAPRHPPSSLASPR